jgi:hypothetical protein
MLTGKNDLIEITAEPRVTKAYCPKHRNPMQELHNGWFSKAYWCYECQVPYELGFVKMLKFDKEAVDKQLEEIKAKKVSK